MVRVQSIFQVSSESGPGLQDVLLLSQPSDEKRVIGGSQRIAATSARIGTGFNFFGKHQTLSLSQIFEKVGECLGYIPFSPCKP